MGGWGHPPSLLQHKVPGHAAMRTLKPLGGAEISGFEMYMVGLDFVS